MDIEDINKLSPEVIVHSILFVAHQEYSEKRKKVTITKAVKLLVRSIEEIEYQQISYGCYKYGEFSFRLHGIVKDIFVNRSLHGAKIDKTLLMDDIIDLVRPIVIELKPIMTGKWQTFENYAHKDRIPLEFQKLYEMHDLFLVTIESMDSIRKKSEFSFYRDTISSIISNLDENLDHVNEDCIKLYFEFTNLVENFLLVTKYRDFNFSHAKKIHGEILDLYKEGVSSLIFPFNQTIKGGNKEYEELVYLENYNRKLSETSKNLNKLRKDFTTYNFNPTIEELDNEIAIEINKLDEADRRDLLLALKS